MKFLKLAICGLLFSSMMLKAEITTEAATTGMKHQSLTFGGGLMSVSGTDADARGYLELSGVTRFNTYFGIGSSLRLSPGDATLMTIALGPTVAPFQTGPQQHLHFMTGLGLTSISNSFVSVSSISIPLEMRYDLPGDSLGAPFKGVVFSPSFAMNFATKSNVWNTYSFGVAVGGRF